VITRTWTFTDDAGNQTTCDQTITVQDTTDPVITCPPDVTFECVMGDAGEATATDNCDSDPEISFTDETVNEFCPTVIERTWVATDSCGNTDSCVQTITIQDTTPPTIACPEDKTFECDAVGDFGFPTAEDNCDPNPVITEVSRDSTAGDCDWAYTLVIGYEAADSCGNADTCYQTINVVDTTPPTIACPEDKTFECDAVGDFGFPTADDNCDPNPVITEVSRDSTAGDCDWAYTLVIGYEAIDGCGNADTCYQTITVEDTTPPTIACPEDKTFECDAVGDFGFPTADDNCDPSPAISEVSRDSTAGDCDWAYTLVIGYEAIDGCGNADTCYQTITVEDTTPPTITCPADKTFECDAVGDFGFPTADDNCDPSPAISEVSRDSTAGDCDWAYTLVIGYEAIDGCGNADTCYQTITVEDTTPPSITCPPDVVFNCEMGDPGLPNVWDNCDPNPSVDFSDVVISESCPYIVERTWTAIDGCGNSNSCTQTITVQDTEAPVITCAPDETVGCNDEVVFTPPTATDNCTANPTIIMVSTDVPDGPGTYTRCWIAVDDCGNESDPCCQTIVVEPCPCTFTIGGWGTECPDSDPGGHPGCIRDEFWDVVFPGGSVMIGHPDGFTATWTSSQAVADFLPDGSTPGVLDQDYVDPTTTSAGVLASQILGLRLNVEYSCAGVFTILGVPTAGECFGDLTIPTSCANGMFDGLTVNEFLAIADSVVAGLSVSGVTPSDVNYTASCLNELHSDCDPFPWLSFAPDGGDVNLARPSSEQIPTVFSLDQNHPNPFNPITDISFGLPVDSYVRLDIYNIRGRTYAASGVYLYKIQAGEYIETRKMLLLK
jgi:hypothetical protein